MINEKWKCPICQNANFEENDEKIICKECGAFFNPSDLDEDLAKRNIELEKIEKEENEKRQKIQLEKEKENQRRVDEKLFTLKSTVDDSQKENNYIVEIYRKKDGSLYTYDVVENKTYEGIPEFFFIDLGNHVYTYHPSKSYLSIIGMRNVATAEIHETKAYETASHTSSGNGCLGYKIDGKNRFAYRMSYSNPDFEILKRRLDLSLSQAGKDEKKLFNDVGYTSDEQQLLVAAARTNNYTAYKNLENNLGNRRALSHEKVNKIIDFIYAACNSTKIDTDEELYTKANDLMKSKDANDYKKAANIFSLIHYYEDSEIKQKAAIHNYEQLSGKNYDKTIKEEKKKEIIDSSFESMKKTVKSNGYKSLVVGLIFASLPIVEYFVLIHKLYVPSYFGNMFLMQIFGYALIAIGCFMKNNKRIILLGILSLIINIILTYTGSYLSTVIKSLATMNDITTNLHLFPLLSNLLVLLHYVALCSTIVGKPKIAKKLWFLPAILYVSGIIVYNQSHIYRISNIELILSIYYLLGAIGLGYINKE